MSGLGRVREFSLALLGEYLRADSEQQVENVVWTANSNANAEQPER
jgi:hypothetical protein